MTTDPPHRRLSPRFPYYMLAPRHHTRDSGTTPYCRNAVGECSHTNHPPTIIDQSPVYPESHSRPRLPLSQASSPPDPSSARINARSTRRRCCVDMIIKAARMQRLMRIEARDDKEKCGREWYSEICHPFLASCQYRHTDCWAHACKNLNTYSRNDLRRDR